MRLTFDPEHTKRLLPHRFDALSMFPPSAGNKRQIARHSRPSYLESTPVTFDQFEYRAADQLELGRHQK